MTDDPGIIICLTQCWACMTNSCYETPRLHPWADQNDIDHAAATGQAVPTGWCGCAFCGEPAVRRAEAARSDS